MGILELGFVEGGQSSWYFGLVCLKHLKWITWTQKTNL